ncbi:MAG: RIP metalloprotease RseP [Bacilli bacterium]|nr:RIP metalloprotease RseP [Bacilli bacterium]
MNAGQWILSILLFIVSLGVLILIHELGHFSMAKLFNVYCHEFSIGFGPALLHKRKKGKETYFSIRCIPLGGYVAMYGEGTEIEGVDVPKERSIEGIKRWKKAIILAAGVILNAFLALTLFAVSNLCFPLRQLSRNISVAENSIAYNAGFKENDQLYFLGPKDDDRVLFDNEAIGDKNYSGSFYILNDDVTFKDEKYVLCWSPNTNNSEPQLSESIKLFPADKDGIIKNSKTFSLWCSKGVELVNYPDIRQDSLKPYADTKFTAKIGSFEYIGKDEEGKGIYKELVLHDVTFNSVSTDGKNYSWENIGLSNKLVDTWLPFGTRIQQTFVDFGNASIAVFRGIGSLFTSGIKNMSGIIGIFQSSATFLTNYVFSTYLYFWGLISVNLAIFNLLPFPGLDGWQLLVTAIEFFPNVIKRKIYEKKGKMDLYVAWTFPKKAKNIVSFIGIALLFALMIAIIGVDIARLAGGL